MPKGIEQSLHIVDAQQLLINDLLNDSVVNGWYMQLKIQKGSFLLSAGWNVDGMAEAKAKPQERSAGS